MLHPPVFPLTELRPPGVSYVAGEASRAKGYDIKTHALCTEGRPLYEIKLCCPHNSHLLPWPDSGESGFSGFAYLYFDEAYDTGWRPRDQVDFAKVRPHAAAQYPVPFQEQQQNRRNFAPPSTPFGIPA